MVKFCLLSMLIWSISLVFYIIPENESYGRIVDRKDELKTEIKEIEAKFKYLKAEREDLLENDRFYIEKLGRERLRLRPQHE